MKPEEALDVLKRMRIAMATANVDGIRVLEPLNIAIAATEKQVAKKVVPRPGYYLHKCHSCDYRQTVDRDEYCWNCGQRLDWSDAE